MCNDSKIFATFKPDSFIDWNKGVTSVIFLAGCNFRCPWCHNLEIVINPHKYPLDFSTLEKELKERKKWCSRVVISGGEPTHNAQLVFIMRKLKALDLALKLDTNGSNPALLSSLVKEELVDYIAMDIKTSLDTGRYSRCCGADVDIGKINKSIDVIISSGIEYQFRTTVVPEFVDDEDITNIRRRIPDSRHYLLQRYSPVEDRKFRVES